MSDAGWIAEAYRCACLARDQGEVPVGAVIVREGRVIASGYNVREKGHDPTAHAEILAIRAAAEILGDWRLEDCTLYVTLEPCPMCLGAAQQARIAEIVYGVSDPGGGALSLGMRFHEHPSTNHRFQVRCFYSGDCGEILSEFFRARRLSRGGSPRRDRT